MPEPSRIYANRLTVSAGERDAVIGADYVHPTFVGDETVQGERVLELVIPAATLLELRALIDAELAAE